MALSKHASVRAAPSMITCNARPNRVHYAVYRVGQKVGHRLRSIMLSNLNRFKKKFTEKFLGKFVVKWIIKLPTHLAYVATLPCETLMSAINDKLQGSVATYLRCSYTTL